MLLANEGRVSYLYRCTGGKVTIGVGHACESTSDACKLAMVTAAGSPAAAAEIANAYAAVSSAPLGLPAKDYRSLSELNLPEDAIDQLWSDDISTFTTSLRKNIPNFDTYPDPAQDALFDMAYNLGIGGLLRITTSWPPAVPETGIALRLSPSAMGSAMSGTRPQSAALRWP